MMKLRIVFFSMALIITYFSGINAYAHEGGRIEGRIIDSETGEGLVGVNVILDGTVLGAATGLHGYFSISQIHPGAYQLSISYIGYNTQRIAIEVSEDKTLKLSIDLKPGSIDLSSILVEAERPFSAASSTLLRKFDIELRPVNSSQELLKLAPGLIIAQHAGGGKAEQIYIRGFDTDHGTDINISVDGLPVNMVTHGHGQGYADLHFLIPETVDEINVYKGPYFTSFGNLSTAASVSFKTKDHLLKNLVKVEGGYFNNAKLTGLFHIPTASEHSNAYFAGQYYRSDGPFISPQNFERFNLFGKFHTHVTDNSKLELSLGAFSSAWDASGQIPDRAVKAGMDRFDAIDDMEGGSTGRQNYSIEYTVGEGSDHEFMLQGYYSDYTFKLFSNFTFWLNDPELGDMIEQVDNRGIGGINTAYQFSSHLGSTITKTTLGGGIRSDKIEVSLWKSPDRVRQYRFTDHSIVERNLFIYIEEEMIFNTQWRLQAGVRGEYFTFDVNDLLEFAGNEYLPDTGIPRTSTFAQESIVLPKLNLVYSPTGSMDIFINAGSSFHSNDARDVAYSRKIQDISNALERKGYSQSAIDDSLTSLNFDPAQKHIKTLPRANGVELGLRTHLGSNLILSLALWGLDMEEELVFVGDEGKTEISGPTRRVGVDFELRYQFTNWLWLDFDINWSRGRYVDEPEGLNYIPLAPNLTSMGGLTARHPSGFDTNLRYRYVGDRPANEANSVQALGHMIFDLYLAYNWQALTFFANFENLANMEWNEAQFDTESRLYNQTEAVSELHYTPGNPFNVQFGLSYSF